VRQLARHSAGGNAHKAGAVTAAAAGGAGAMRPRDPHRFPAGSSTFAPTAHGGLPPERDPGHCPLLADRRHARQPRQAENTILPAIQH
jgi:hypothetical protein